VGYKHYGNGGYTTFIAEVLDAVVQSQKEEQGYFNLEQILSKKTKAHRRY